MSTALSNLFELRNVRNKRVSSYDRAGGELDRIVIPAGETAIIADIHGAGVIRHIWCTFISVDPMIRRNAVIRMYWDHEETPSVEAPLGDFFGQGWGEAYNMVSLPLAAAPKDGRSLNCYFPMPFATGAKITVENQSDQSIRAFYFYVDYEELLEPCTITTRFHAWWNREITDPGDQGENEWGVLHPPANNPSDADNYLLLDAEGSGHVVGVNYFVDSPTPMWYGEGDDMWLIDGEPWPGSLHGTGTEDFFNSAWSPKEVYMHPYFGYPRVNNNTGWLGRTHCYRFLIEDPIRFQKSIRASIEHGHANNLVLDICTVVYWYQTEPHKVFPPLVAKELRQNMPEIGVRDIHRWRHAWRESMGGGKLWGHELK
jgi:hypothetical protein